MRTSARNGVEWFDGARHNMTGKANMPIYNSCGRKLSYSSLEAATEAGRNRPVTLWAYRCPHCGWWHLSSGKKPRFLRNRSVRIEGHPLPVPEADISDFGRKLLDALGERL